MSAADPSKRVFMTIGDSSEFLKKPDKNTGTANGKSKTLRFDLDLFEPDEYKFPEYNYKKLVHIEKKKQKKISKLPNGNHADPFGGEDGDVERITRELEAKYGSGSSYSKSSRLTTVDRGAGYDASDSFIDDTEAYDELIPEEIETDRGGFYINSGALEFKKLSNYERPGDEIRMPKAKKRALSSSSESSESDGAEEEKAVEKPNKKHVEKKVKSSATSSSDEQGKAKKSKKEKQEKLEKPEKLEKAKEVPKEVQPQVKEPEKKKTVEKELEKVCKTTTVKDMLRAKRDNMRKMEQGKPTSSGATTATDNDDEDGESESVSSLAVSESSRDSHPEIAPVNGVKDSSIPLPENLPTETIAAICSLKNYAETNINAKTNFFDTNTLDQLVKIDNGAKSVSSHVRVQTFNYLEHVVPCTKKTLFAKVRRHRMVQNELKLKNDVNKLRKIVIEAMPAAIAKHNQDMKKYEELMLIQSVVGDTSYEHTQPRKKFHWSENSRVLLFGIILHLQDLYKITKSNKESESDFVSRKLTEDVVPLWPEGWMKLVDLMKEFERKKKKKEARTSNAPPQTPPQAQTKLNTASATAASTTATNGKSAVHVQKTETNMKSNELEILAVNGKATTQKSAAPALSVSAASVIKRSSDHSISSIISTSPSPPTTSQSQKIQEPNKTRVIELDELTCQKELIKSAQPKSTLPRFAGSPIDVIAPEKSVIDKVRRSNSSDSDCVEIVGEFNPIKPAKSVYNHNNNNKMNQSTSPHPAPIAKKVRTHGSDDGEHETDYSKIIMGIQSLTDPKKSNQFLVQNPLTSPVAQQQRKAETSHGNFELNGTSDHFLDPKMATSKNFSHNNNLHYSIGDLVANSNRLSHEGNSVKGNNKSSDQFKPSLHYSHQQQLNSSTNNNLHSISLSLASPALQMTSHERKPSNVGYAMPSILNLSNKK